MEIKTPASLICGFDQTIHQNIDSLYEHLKRFRISREKYFHTYEPRKDPITGELIPFKNLDQYLSQEFISKITLRKWLETNPEVGWRWSKNWLTRRKNEKSLIYAPSQVELRTLCTPSMPYFDGPLGINEGGYYGVTKTLGFTSRYKTARPSTSPLSPSAFLIQDTREQTPIRFPIDRRVIIDTLNVGDYALAAPYDMGIRIERKSISDFCGTMTNRKVARKGGHKGEGPTEDSPLNRFDRELARAKDSGLYVVMMIEGSLNTIQSVNYLPQYKWIKASSDYLLHNLRDLLVKYPLTWQVVFIDVTKHTMADKLTRVLEIGVGVKEWDLQAAYERGDL